MQMKKKLVEERGSMAVYVLVVLLSFVMILTGVYFSSTSTRKAQLTTVLKIKQSYEVNNGNIEQIYQKLANGGQEESNYVKNGLILHYDGINNTGNGHSATATTWKDLSAKGNDGNLSKATDSTTFYWDSNNITLSGVSSSLGTYIDTPINLNGKERTIIYTVDAKNLTGSMWGDTDTSNMKGLINYYTFVANRAESGSGQIRYAYDFAKEGIYNYAVSLSENQMKFYINGVLTNTTTNTVGLATSNNLRILAAYYSSQNATNLKMYNFMVYDRVLNDDEVTKNYQAIQQEYQLPTE